MIFTCAHQPVEPKGVDRDAQIRMRGGVAHSDREGLARWHEPGGSGSEVDRPITVLLFDFDGDGLLAGVQSEVVMRERQVVDFGNVVLARLEENSWPVERLDWRRLQAAMQRKDLTCRATIE